MVSQPMTYLYVVTVLLFYIVFCKYRFLAFAFQIIL